ncbi:hypothetical protein G6F56_000193 [Rhizopus delemar]|nr:hypothetical protein G6F56_000193 [Rhizopus delemar]
MTSTLPTIKEFLASVKLEQYHEAIIRSGANEQDIELMIHSYFEKLDVIAFQAIIYGRHQSRSLTSYEKAINEAAAHLALENPTLLSKKGDLFKQAKKKLLDDGFVYKRGKSRSKLTKEIPQSSLRRQTSLPKRQENAERASLERQEKIKCLEKKVEDILRSRQVTENELEACSYDIINERSTMEAKIVSYEDEKRQLTRQISKLKAQERKHKWYYRRKSENGSSNSSQTADDEFSSQLSLSFNSVEDEDEDDENDKPFSIYSVESTLCTRESDVRASNLNKD